MGFPKTDIQLLITLVLFNQSFSNLPNFNIMIVLQLCTVLTYSDHRGQLFGLFSFQRAKNTVLSTSRT